MQTLMPCPDKTVGATGCDSTVKEGKTEDPTPAYEGMYWFTLMLWCNFRQNFLKATCGQD